jgi:hypothetical protein
MIHSRSDPFRQYPEGSGQQFLRSTLGEIEGILHEKLCISVLCLSKRQDIGWKKCIDKRRGSSFKKAGERCICIWASRWSFRTVIS